MIGSLSEHDSNGSENVTWKINTTWTDANEVCNTSAHNYYMQWCCSPRCLICQILSNFSGDKFQRTVSKCNLEKKRKFKMSLCPPKSTKLGIFTSKKQTSFICCPTDLLFSYEFLLVTRGEFHEIYLLDVHSSSFAMFK